MKMCVYEDDIDLFSLTANLARWQRSSQSPAGMRRPRRHARRRGPCGFYRPAFSPTSGRARLPLPAILDLRVPLRLPLHVAYCVRATASQRIDVVDDVPRAASVRLAGTGTRVHALEPGYLGAAAMDPPVGIALEGVGRQWEQKNQDQDNAFHRVETYFAAFVVRIQP